MSVRRNPHQIYKRVQEPPEERGRNVIVIECLQEYPWCGLEGRIPYQHLPRTPFQARCREQATSDLQHYTRCLKPEIVERVANIPLKPGSDYRSKSVTISGGSLFVSNISRSQAKIMGVAGRQSVLCER